MSTNRVSQADHISLTTFFGGNTSGECIQVTERSLAYDPRYITLNRNQALLLAADLLVFGRGGELEEEV